MARPDLSRVPAWYHKYIEQTEGEDLLSLLEGQLHSFSQFMRQVPENKHLYRYAEGKWTIKDLFQHIIDAERIFAYRALRFARNDNTPLPGFEENDYAIEAKSERREWHGMLEEFISLRTSNIVMFSNFSEEELEREGIASGKSIYVLAIGFILAGHVNHHVKVIRERYLV